MYEKTYLAIITVVLLCKNMECCVLFPEIEVLCDMQTGHQLLCAMSNKMASDMGYVDKILYHSSLYML